MPPEEAERKVLSEWAIVTRDRDTRVRAAVAAGLTRHRIHLLTGVGRSALDGILATTATDGPVLDQSWAISWAIWRRR